MATNSCVWVPNADNGKQSKLFKDLMSHLGNRDDAKLAWGFTKTDFFKSAFKDIEKDENGEPTFDALNKALNLDSLLDDTKKDMNRALDLGLVTPAGKAVSFTDANVVMSKAEEFNEKATRKVAVVRKADDGKYIASIEDNRAYNIADADTNKARRQLNLSLLNILQRLGFNIEFADDPKFYGVFDPLLAEKNAENLRTVIQVANGEKGLDALPEEVCHLILAGLKHNELKIRLDKVVNDDVVRAVLGDKYYDYYKKYNNGKTPVKDRLRDEAEGQMLAAMLKGENINITKKQASGFFPLLRRILDKALGLFRKSKVSDIDNAFINAQNTLGDIKAKIESGEISQILSDKDIMENEKMFALQEQVENLANIAQQGEIQLSKQLYILNQLKLRNDTKELDAKIKAVQSAMDNQHYAQACYIAMQTIGKEISDLVRLIDMYGKLYDNSTDLQTILEEANVVERVKFALEAYEPFMNTMIELPTLVERGAIEMSKDWVDPIVEMANKFNSQFVTLKNNMGEMRKSVLKEFLSLFYGINGKKPDNIKETDKFKWESIDMILDHANKDISFWDTSLFSAGDSRNPLINIIHNVVVRQEAERNLKIQSFIARMQEIDSRLKKAGHDNNFVYDVDKDGIATGYYKSERDFARYEKERIEYAESLEKLKIDEYRKQEMIRKWEFEHTEPVEVGKYLNKYGRRRVEYMPKKDLYPVADFQKGWTKAQKEYYKDLMDLKDEMDDMLPGCYHSKYLAPQVRRSVTQAFDKGGRGFWGTIFHKLKQRYSVVEDNPDYGVNSKIEGGKRTLTYKQNGVVRKLTDYNNNVIKKVPVYYLHKLDDLRDLSTDATRGMCNYICMAVNFNEMGKFSGVMRLLKDHIRTDYRVKLTHGNKRVVDYIRAAGQEAEKEASMAAMDSRIGKQLDEYIDRMFFNETKNVLGNVVNQDAIFNVIMYITSVSRMGFNILSGITNATQGEHQMINEAAAGRFFNYNDMAFSKKEYSKLLLDYLGQFNSADRHDKMYLLINTFNSSEDFFRDMMDKDFNKSPFKRVMGRGNVYFMNTVGEHYLHTSGMLNILHHEKVKRTGSDKVVTLYDCIKPVHDKNGWHLELDSDIEFVDKNRAFLQNTEMAPKNGIIKKSERDVLFKNLAVYINRINANMHGGYSQAERGNFNKYAGWRFVLQFRQWMFGMYNKNFRGEYYQASTNTIQKGAYRSMMKFMVGTIHDLGSMSLKQAIENNRLSEEERQNARVAWVQSACYLFLMLLGALAVPDMKDKDKRGMRLLAYQIKRLELETGALCPVNPAAFFGNMFTLVQSPAASISTFKEFLPLLDVVSMFGEVSSGRYAGWNKAARALFRVTPLYNVQKVIDMKDYNYMFNIFK